MGPDGTVAARDAAFIVPNPLKIQEQAGFTVLLPARPNPGSRLSFTYRYNAVEDVEGSASWMQSFDADL